MEMEMHDATITVEYVNPPDKNPDFGSVKAGGRYYGVPTNMLSQFTVGQVYSIGYTITKGTKGATFYNLKKIRSLVGTAPAVGHNNPPNGRGVEKDTSIIAQVIFKGAWQSFAARSEAEINRHSMGDFWFECLLAADWGLTKYKKFWAEKNAPKLAPKPQPEPEPIDDIADTFR